MTGKHLVSPALLIGLGLIQQAQPPTFRTSASIVPIDVRVVDKNGKAVTDLTRADFTVIEDGVAQRLTQFEKQTADDPAHRRWIVVVLGEGRINAPFKSIDALEDMIRNSLAATDRVGVIAYNRWSEFSADHAATVRLLERYKARNDRIQTDLETYNSGLRRETHNGLMIEDSVQSEIDAIFRDAPGQAVREFAPPSQMGRMSPGFEVRTRFTQGRFSDLLHLYGAIDYLRIPEGEKHIILMVEQETPYGRARPSRIATTAADLRIALHIVQTGGFGGRSTVTPYRPSSRFQGVVHPPTSTAADFNTSRSAHDVTEDTGGLAFSYTDLRKAFERIGEAIRVDYLLGYVPTNENWHGEYRHIDVHVSRPGVTAIYRRGYDAALTPPPWNDRDTMTDVRLAEARTAVRPPRDLNLLLKATRTPDRKVNVELQIEPSQVAFATVDEHHVARLDVAVWITDRQGETIGTIVDRIDLRLTDDDYGKLVKQNVVYTRALLVTGTPFDVRAAVYDYDNDRVGAGSTRMR